MTNTIKEIKELYEKEFRNEEIYDIEVYKPCSWGRYYPNCFHTDNCNFVDESEWNDETKVGLHELMNEEDYQHSIDANNSIPTNFEEWYGDKNAKVLVLMLADDYDCDNEDESEEPYSFSQEEFEDELSDFYDSCMRTGHYDMEECARYYCREYGDQIVDHQKINYYQVLEGLQKIDKYHSDDK